MRGRAYNPAKNLDVISALMLSGILFTLNKKILSIQYVRSSPSNEINVPRGAAEQNQVFINKILLI